MIQEDAQSDGRSRHAARARDAARHIRAARTRFPQRGRALARAGRRLTARDLALLAAGDIATSKCAAARSSRLPPRATNSRIPERRKPGGIVASSGYGLAPMIADWGGEPLDLGILPDTIEALRTHSRTRARRRSGRHAGRRFGRRPRSRAARAGAERLRARFLENRDAAGQAADLRAAGGKAVSRPARQSGVRRSSARFCSCGPLIAGCWA